MTPPGTFERVYSAIKQRLRNGVYRPGTRLEPAVLSDELNASVTPVRDALHRLTGERLVEAPRQEGFRVPMMTEGLLRQLYSWHRDLLLLALASHRSGPMAALACEAGSGAGSGAGFGAGSGAGFGAAPHDRQNALFAALARSAGNPEHLAALEALSHRLEPAQRLEQLFLGGIEAETEEILEALKANDRKALRASLVRYHRRREKIVSELLSGMLGL